MGVKLPILIGLAVAAIAAPAAAETLITPPAAGFVPAYKAQQGNVLIVEQVPQGETVTRWSRMITTQRIAGMRVPANGFLTEMGSRMLRACGGGSVNPMPRGTGDGVRIDCNRSTLTGKPETTFVRAINGRNDLYVVQVAMRGIVMPNQAQWARTYLNGVMLRP